MRRSASRYQPKDRPNVRSREARMTKRNRNRSRHRAGRSEKSARRPRRKLALPRSRQIPQRQSIPTTRRGDRLQDVVFLNRRVAEIKQDRHRNHRGRNRRRKSETSLEPEINVRRGENQRDDNSDDQSTDRKFSAHMVG